MGNQCVNTRCGKSFQDHGSNCTACGRPLISTPDSGPSYENSPRAQISSSFGGISRSNPSPANSSPFLVGQNSPTSYGSPSMHLEAPAFRHPHAVHNLPAPHAYPPYEMPGYGSSTAILNPYSTTSIISNIPNGYSSPASTHNHSPRPFRQTATQFQAPLPNTSFEIYDPKADKTASNRKRSCISCYRSNRTCRTNEGATCCQSCVGKPKYCRGVIHTPSLVDTQPWFESTTALIASPLSVVLEEVHLFDIQVSLNISSHEDKNLLAGARAHLPQNYHLDLRGLRSSTTTNVDHSKLAGILDMVYNRSTRGTEESIDAKINILESSQCSARRFVTCLMTLRNFRRCTLNTTFSEESTSPYIILEFLHQLSSEAGYLFRKFFEALNAFLEGPRHKQSFTKQLLLIASTLGQMHKALKSLESGLEDGPVPHLGITALHHVSPATLDELQNLGNFFNPIGFRAGSEMVPSELPGIHIELLSPGGLADRIARRQLGETVTFLDILQRSLGVEAAQAPVTADVSEIRSPKVEALISSVESPCQDALSMNALIPSHQSPRAESQLKDLPPNERRELEEQCRVQIFDLESALQEEIERHRAETERHRIRKLELEEKICLLSLSLGLDLPTQNSSRAPWPIEEESIQTEPMIPDSSQSSGAATLVAQSSYHSNKAQIHVDSRGNPSNEPTQPSTMHLEATEMKDTVMSSSISGHASENTAYNVSDHVSPAIRKRKRISDYFFSFKKHRVAGAIDKMDSSQAYSKNSKPTDPLRKFGSSSNDHTASGKMRMSQIFTCRQSPCNRKWPAEDKVPTCKDIVPAMSQSNPGSDRPLSWPRSRRWRKSFGVSVKGLREGFEKMTVEQVEPVPPLPPSI